MREPLFTLDPDGGGDGVVHGIAGAAVTGRGD
jgi:hypothetical protein